MPNVFVNEDSLSDIADAIRSKLGVQTTYKPGEMADAIEAISGGGITPTGTKQISITENGTTMEDITNYADAEITVNVPNGGGGGTEVTTSVACTNALDCLNHIFPTRGAANHIYVAYLKNKSNENFQTDQLVGLFAWGTSSYGIGVRWRNSGFNTIGGLSSSYDAKIAVGDVFETYEISYA